MDIGDKVASRIIDLLFERDITLNKLSIICGINQSTLNNIVNRNNNSPTIRTINSICEGLDMELVEFFDHEIFGIEQ